MSRTILLSILACCAIALVPAPVADAGPSDLPPDDTTVWLVVTCVSIGTNPPSVSFPERC